MKNIYLILLFVILIAFVIFYNCDNKENFEVDIADEKTILQLYQIMYDVDQIFTKYGINYIVEGGTLLGTIRHKGIIPFDDDADVEIDKNDVPLFLSTTIAFKNKGYDIVETWFGYKIFSENAKQVEGYNWKYPALDVFIVEKTGDRYKFSYDRAEKTFGKCYFKIDELYPLKRYTFGEIEVNGPAKYKEYLDRCYGTDWNDIYYKQYDHEHEKHLKKVKYNLTKEDREPAKPTGPIIR